MASVSGHLTPDRLDAYWRDGFVVVPDVLSAAEVAELRAVTDEFTEQSRAVGSGHAFLEVEPSHTAERPRLRRIRTPEQHHPVYAAVVRHPAILDALCPILGDAIGFDAGKLNMKTAEAGAPVEWHQDWGFYPHTNDDLCAVGVMLDDCDEDNGALMCVPGSHRGPVYDHTSNGTFVGAIDPTTVGLDLDRALPCIGRAGSISIHHVRTVHGSAPNTSNRMRRLFLLQYRAADAWPLVNDATTWDRWRASVVCGDADQVRVRVSDVPVVLPFPAAPHQGSIYENQRTMANPYFATVN